MAEQSKYRAPALQKGLEILELLAASDNPLSLTDISGKLGRSVSELFRMLQVLEEHGYISRSGDGYQLTSRLMLLGMSKPPVRDLLSCALPAMRDLCNMTGQSAHLAIASGAEMVVIAHIEAPGLLGFSVRFGYRRPLVQSASGHTLLAFQSEAQRIAMLDNVRKAGIPFKEGALNRQLDQIRNDGQLEMLSPVLNAITDISSPIGRSDAAVAALTVPYMSGPAAILPKAASAKALAAAAKRITEELLDPITP
jgi:DNA-binding IclR family transcriptional regulator